MVYPAMNDGHNSGFFFLSLSILPPFFFKILGQVHLDFLANLLWHTHTLKKTWLIIIFALCDIFPVHCSITCDTINLLTFNIYQLSRVLGQCMIFCKLYNSIRTLFNCLIFIQKITQLVDVLGLIQLLVVICGNIGNIYEFYNLSVTSVYCIFFFF